MEVVTLKRSNFSFTNAPVLRRQRTSFDLSHSLFTTLNVGVLKPILIQEVYPGDQFNINQVGVIRNFLPFKKPIMDNLFFDSAYFFVPYRLICSEFENCITGGNAEPNDWVEPQDVDIPTYTSGKVYFDGVLDNLGINPYVKDSQTSAKGLSVMPARAFAKIWNDWFRDENVEQSCNIIKSGVGSNEVPNGDAWSPTNYVGRLPKVNKLHDYFTSALRSPQKGDAVEVTNLLNISGTAPVYPMSGYGVAEASSINNLNVCFRASASSSSRLEVPSASSLIVGKGTSPTIGYNSDFAATKTGNLTGTNLRVNLGDDGFYPADITFNGLDVNALRYAFALQKILERTARSGSRYTEYIHSAFGVTASDARLQRSEFLSGSSQPINIQQVANTFGEELPTGSTTLGNLSAFSLTNASTRASKAFTEHGYIIGVAWIRQFHTYSQGIEKFWSKTSRYDFYDPSLQNIGEQPVYTTELYAPVGLSAGRGGIFGYQEAFADLRYRPNRVTGFARKSVYNYSAFTDTGMSLYSLSDLYDSVPTLSADFVNETPDYVWDAMGIGTPSPGLSQFIVDVRFNIKAIRELPAYSVPSLIDHN